MLSLVQPQEPSPLLERLFTESAGDLARYFARRHGGPDAADDLVQETFLQMARSLEHGRQAASARGYLFGIARRVSQAFWSSRRKEEKVIPFNAVEHDASIAPADDRVEATRETIAALEPLQREILDLRFAQGLSYAEIAEALGIPLGTVRSRLHHAVAAVRTRLDDELL